ncbi:hypothetical protein [Microbacterium profundi]
MKDDPHRQEIYAELRQLRRGAGEFGMDRIATAFTITDFVGRGSVERAYGALLDALVRHGSDPESDIRAYFDTSGFQAEGDNLDQRLSAYSDLHHVDQRTALRRSDRGAEKLSYILRDTLTIERPWGKLAVSEVGGVVTIGVQVDVPHNAQWRRPHVYINGEQHERDFVLHDSESSDFFATAKERFDRIPLLSSESDDDVFEAKVFWVMPVWPIWVTSAGFTTPGLVATFTMERNSGATISIWGSWTPPPK